MKINGYTGNCFTNYIGVLDTDQSTSGLYIRDLGIPISQASATANDHFTSGESFLRDKLRVSVEIVKDEIKEYIQPYFKLNTILDEIRTGEYQDVTIPASALYRGIKITKTVNSRLSKLFVKRVKLLSSSNATGVTLRIQDENFVTTTTFNLTAGVVTEIQLDYEAFSDEIYITTDNTNVDFYSVKNENIAGSCGCNSCSCSSSKYFTVKGYNGTSLVSEMYGIVADVSVICSEDELMCILAPYMKFAILYKVGEEFFSDVQLTDRINYFTLPEIDYIKLEEKYADRYKKKIKSLLESLPALLNNLDNFCINCTQAKYVESF